MHILYISGRELAYPRNDVLLRAFQRFGTVDVIGGKTHTGPLVGRSLRVGLRALPRVLTRPYDLIFVGFYGHLLMLPIGRVARAPILFDAFVSTYDTLCWDRRTFAPGSLIGRLAFQLDRISCRLASRILLDTPQHVKYFVDTFGLPASVFQSLPVGCNEDDFFPRPQPQHAVQRVLYYSNYLPLHGMETVVRAAAELRSEPGLEFRLIGQGQEYRRVRRLADDLNLSNTTFVPPVPLRDLPAEIAAADICLGGHFGQSPKASRVIPGKIYQILAMERPTIAGDTLANRELLTHATTAYLCAPNSAQALAGAILALHRDETLRHQLAAAGRALYQARCSEAVITHQLHNGVDELIGQTA